MSGAITKQAQSAEQVKQEVRQLKEAAQKVASTKAFAIRFLASTGMYCKSGALKPQFS